MAQLRWATAPTWPAAPPPLSTECGARAAPTSDAPCCVLLPPQLLWLVVCSSCYSDPQRRHLVPVGPARGVQDSRCSSCVCYCSCKPRACNTRTCKHVQHTDAPLPLEWRQCGVLLWLGSTAMHAGQMRTSRKPRWMAGCLIGGWRIARWLPSVSLLLAEWVGASKWQTHNVPVRSSCRDWEDLHKCLTLGRTELCCGPQYSRSSLRNVARRCQVVRWRPLCKGSTPGAARACSLPDHSSRWVAGRLSCATTSTPEKAAEQHEWLGR